MSTEVGVLPNTDSGSLLVKPGASCHGCEGAYSAPELTVPPGSGSVAFAAGLTPVASG